jgi:hypothetical protein
VLDDGKAVAYSWKGKDHVLRFARVEAAGGSARPAYVATTEMSVGLFIDTVAAADRWAEAKGLLKIYDPEQGPPKGLYVWEWERDGDRIRVARQWLAGGRRRTRAYPDGLDPGKPAADHPMQTVSLPASLYVARLLGCRLPSPGEWEAALNTAGAPAKPNLRDAAWGKQQDFVRTKRAANIALEWPDTGIFWPPGAERREGGAAVAASKDDDGVLWFARVGQPDAFHHLVGNVAELVLERPDRFDAEFRKGGELKGSAVRAYAEKHEADARVVGGSALSAPAVWNGAERPFHKTWPLDQPASRDGWADVGFRLAFTAPRESPAARLQRILRARGYLPELTD